MLVVDAFHKLIFQKSGCLIWHCGFVQSAGDGAGGDCRQCPARPADPLRHHGLGAGESQSATGTGSAGGDDAELYR